MQLYDPSRQSRILDQNIMNERNSAAQQLGQARESLINNLMERKKAQDQVNLQNIQDTAAMNRLNRGGVIESGHIGERGNEAVRLQNVADTAAGQRNNATIAGQNTRNTESILGNARTALQGVGINTGMMLPNGQLPAGSVGASQLEDLRKNVNISRLLPALAAAAQQGIEVSDGSTNLTDAPQENYVKRIAPSTLAAFLGGSGMAELIKENIKTDERKSTSINGVEGPVVENKQTNQDKISQKGKNPNEALMGLIAQALGGSLPSGSPQALVPPINRDFMGRIIKSANAPQQPQRQQPSTSSVEDTSNDFMNQFGPQEPVDPKVADFVVQQAANSFPGATIGRVFMQNGRTIVEINGKNYVADSGKPR